MNKYFSVTIIIFLSLFSFSCADTHVNPGGKGPTGKIKPDTPPPSPKPPSPKPSSEGKSILDSYSGSYALLIGESDYTNGWPDLNSIPRELKKVETILKAQGFKVEKSLNLNASKLEGRFKKFINDYGYKPNNRLLFFYSGHGHTDGGQGFLVPTDAPNPDKDIEGFLKKSLVMTDITALARKIRAKHVLFLFDSCFSGSVFKAKERPKVPRQITKLANEPVRQFITAGSENETVPANSVFTPAFVDALEYGLGDLTQDGYITGQELGLYLQGEVPQHTNQTPQYGKIRDYDLSRGDFVFIVGANAVVKPKPVATVVPPKLSHGKVFQDRLKDGSFGPKMVWIKAGSFRMGDIQGGGDDDEKPVHEVYVDRFAMGQTEVTFNQYNKSINDTGRHRIVVGGGPPGDVAVDWVSWDDAVVYAAWLSKQTGKNYRLPTEAEWEYAARAGTSTKYSFGNDINRLGEYALYGKGFMTGYPSIGIKKPNPWGLYDMHGSQWEWTCSEYKNKYQGSEKICNKTASFFVLRGGSWTSEASFARSANRHRDEPLDKNMNYGFRLVRTP